MKNLARSWGIAAVSVAAMLLSGCGTEPAATPTDEVGSSSTSPTTAPSAAPTGAPVVVASEPRPVLPLTCADLLPIGIVKAAVASDVVLNEYFTDPQRAFPAAYSVQQRGGWVCSAGNGGGGPSETSSVTLWVMPEADGQFAVYEGMYPGVVRGPGSPYGEASNVGCFGRAAESMCSVNVHVNGYWVELYTEGIDVDSSFSDSDVASRIAPLISAVVTPLNTAGAAAAVWTPPADTLQLATDCAVLAPAGEIRSHLGYSEDIRVTQVTGPRGGWSVPSGAAEEAGMLDCLWGAVGYENPIGSIHALPGGAWAYDAARAVMVAAGNGHDILTPIAGVEKASFYCLPTSIDSCTLSFEMGGNWLVMNAGIPAGGDAASLEGQMTILTGVVSSHAHGL